MQRGDLRGEVGDVLLGAVDDGEPFVQFGQVLGGLLRAGVHRLAEPVRHRIEPFVDVARQFSLPSGQHVAHRLHVDGGFALKPLQLRHARLGGGVVRGRPRPSHENGKRRDAKTCD